MFIVDFFAKHYNWLLSGLLVAILTSALTWYIYRKRLPRLFLYEKPHSLSEYQRGKSIQKGQTAIFTFSNEKGEKLEVDEGDIGVFIFIEPKWMRDVERSEEYTICLCIRNEGSVVARSVKLVFSTEALGAPGAWLQIDKGRLPKFGVNGYFGESLTYAEIGDIQGGMEKEIKVSVTIAPKVALSRLYKPELLTLFGSEYVFLFSYEILCDNTRPKGKYLIILFHKNLLI